MTFLQVGVVYLLAMWLEGRNSPTSVFAASLFLVVAGNVAYVHSRVDAMLELITQDSSAASDAESAS